MQIYFHTVVNYKTNANYGNLASLKVEKRMTEFVL